MVVSSHSKTQKKIWCFIFTILLLITLCGIGIFIFRVITKNDTSTTTQTHCECDQIAQQIFNKHLSKILPLKYFDESGNRCFCMQCIKARKEDLVHSTGDPPKKYSTPIGWIRFGLKNKQNNTWYVCVYK